MQVGLQCGSSCFLRDATLSGRVITSVSCGGRVVAIYSSCLAGGTSTTQAGNGNKEVVTTAATNGYTSAFDGAIQF